MEQELNIAEDGGQHIIEIVSHAACHLSHRPQLLGLDDLILGMF